MKPILLFFLLALCGSTLFGKATHHTRKRVHHLRKQVHYTHRHLRRKPNTFAYAAPPVGSDTRQLALWQYFQNCACPAAHWATTFVQEADRQGLDWRLVASIAMIESTGGKHYKNRNILGWGSAAARFRSEQAGIQHVSARLSRSPLYRGKSLLQMLRTYNSVRRNYAVMVTGVMQRLTTIENNLRVQQAKLLPDIPPFFQPEPESLFAKAIFAH